MTVFLNDDLDDPGAHHPGCPTPGGCSEHGCHGACLPDEDPDPEKMREALVWIEQSTAATPGLTDAGLGALLAEIGKRARHALLPNTEGEMR